MPIDMQTRKSCQPEGVRLLSLNLWRVAKRESALHNLGAPRYLLRFLLPTPLAS
jgi:hypothetical protein